jgi:hypothetical protein
VVTFYVLIYVAFYIGDSFFLYYVGAASPGIAPRILSATVGLILASAIVYALNHRSGISSILRSLGFRREGILRSSLWANAFLLPIMIFLMSMLFVSGPQSIPALNGAKIDRGAESTAIDKITAHDFGPEFSQISLNLPSNR